MGGSTTRPTAGLDAIYRELLALAARVEHLEQENRVLRVAGMEASDAREARVTAPVPSPTVSVSRRQLLRRAGATAVGVAALAVSATSVLPATTALADTPEPINVGDDITDAQSTTILRNEVNDEDVLQVKSDNAGTGLLGISTHGRGVWGTSSTGIGITGSGHRGGSFWGSKANINLEPSPYSSHSHTGLRGDLVVDKHGRLWYCKGDTNWHQLA